MKPTVVFLPANYRLVDYPSNLMGTSRRLSEDGFPNGSFLYPSHEVTKECNILLGILKGIKVPMEFFLWA